MGARRVCTAKVGVRSPVGPPSLGVWCNGNTTDFDSVILGSNPSTPAAV